VDGFSLNERVLTFKELDQQSDRPEA